MIKTLQNMTAALVCCCLMFMSSAIMAQCPCSIDGTASYGSATASIYADISVGASPACHYAGEYADFTVVAGATYEITVVISSTSTSTFNAPAVTIFNSADSTAVACGLDMASFTASYDGVYHALATEFDGADYCITEDVCHNLSIVCTSCTEDMPTCTDGIMNGDETGVDCGGSVCATCPTLIQSCDTTYIDSGGTTTDYFSNTLSTTTYCPALGAGGNIQAVFTAFATESCCDNLSVYDGDVADPAFLIDTFAGSELPNTMIANNDGCLTFVFSSDGSVTAAGWEADITCVSCTLPTLIATAYCDGENDSEYYVEIDFTPGNGTSYTLSDGTNTVALNDTPSIFNVGPYANGTVIDFVVTDDNDVCNASASATNNCTPGITCDNPILIASLPYVETGATTEGFGDDYDSSDVCESNYMTGDDIVYNFVAADTCVNITLTNTDAWAGVFLLDGCPEASTTTCVATANNSSAGNPFIEGASLTVGMDYYVIISTYASPQFTAFDIEIAACPLCTDPIFTATAYCDGENDSEYYVEIDFTPGNGTSYTLSDGTNTVALNDTPSIFNVGPYANGTVTDFVVTDDNDVCNASASATNNCAPGITCDNPILIASLPYVETGATTEGFGDDYGSSDVCGSSYMTGDDIVYNFVAADTCVNITLTNTDSWAGVFLLDGCPEASTTTCVAAADNGSAGNPSIEGASLTVGMDYYVIISTWATPQFTAFDIEIAACPMPCIPIEVTLMAEDVSCAGNDGAVNITSATGGSGTYVSIEWNNGIMGSTSISGLTMGDYMVTITDDMGCTGEATVTVGDGCVAACGETSNLMSNIDSTNPLEVTLSWDAVSGAEAYQLAGRKQGGSTKVFPETQNTSRTFTNGLLYETTYQWSVRVKCNGTWTDYVMPVGTFTTPASSAKNNADSYDIFAEGNNLTVNVYPNPANQQVVLQLNEAVNFDKVATQKTVQITDMLGRAVNTYNTSETQMTLDVSEYANGSYFVAISNGQETVVEKLLIVR